jgi:orotate phosphoribosyltransferase
MNQQQVLEEFYQADALLKGHFILSSGLHSDTYLQCARVLMNPKRAERLCAALTEKIRRTVPDIIIDYVVSPAMGGVVVGYEMARQLGVEACFCERVDGVFALRRGFSLPTHSRVLVVEDVVTTGKSSLEAYRCIEEQGACIVAEACLIDRSSGNVSLGVPLISLASLSVEAFEADKLPEYLRHIPAVKPGSRWLKQSSSS